MYLGLNVYLKSYYNMNSRENITDKFNSRFAELDRQLKINARKMNFPLYITPIASSEQGNYNKYKLFGGLGTQNIASTTSGSFRKQTISDTLVIPYVFMFECDVGLFTQAFYLTDGAAAAINLPTAQFVGPFTEDIVGYFDTGILYVDIAVSPNPVKLASPALVSSANSAGPAVFKTFGFRELAFGQVEIYNNVTDSWYTVRGTQLGTGTRRVNAHLGFNKTYTINTK